MICESCGQRVRRQDLYCVYCRERLPSAGAFFGALVIAGVGICMATPMFLFDFNVVITGVVMAVGLALALWVFLSRR